MEIHYHGQSCFEFMEGPTNLIVDPFLKPNSPVADVSADEVEPTVIALTHGHVDHMADAVPLARRTGAQVIAIVEVAKWFEGQGCENVADPNFGGTVSFDGGSVKLVPAWHTNTLPGDGDDPFSAEKGTPVGPAAGLIIKVGGVTIYDAGDTCLFGDMQMIGERHKPDIALLPIGGHYTMDIEDAAYAAKLIGAPTVIPMHFNTFPAIEADPQAFADAVKAEGSDAEVVILAPGESHTA